MEYQIRDFHPEDAAEVDQVALAAYQEYRSSYSDWEVLARNIGEMSSMAAAGELIVAIAEDRVVGAVVYVGPGRPKSPFFEPEWPVIRMLSVAPAVRGYGIGRALTEECIQRARRDGAPVIALHTSAIMKVALPMYQRLGFEFHGEAPPLFGVPYGVYLKELNG